MLSKERLLLDVLDVQNSRSERKGEHISRDGKYPSGCLNVPRSGSVDVAQLMIIILVRIYLRTFLVHIQYMCITISYVDFYR